MHVFENFCQGGNEEARTGGTDVEGCLQKSHATYATWIGICSVKTLQCKKCKKTLCEESCIINKSHGKMGFP